MKKNTLLLNTVCLSLLAVSCYSYANDVTASTDNNEANTYKGYNTRIRPYFGVRLGATFSSLNAECNDDGYDYCYRYDGDNEIDDETLFGVHPFVGVSFPINRFLGIRGELEGNFNSKATYHYTSYDYYNSYRDKMTVKSNALLANVYFDFYTVNDYFVPYLSAGLGTAWNDIDITNNGQSYSQNETDFAFQIGTGANINLTNNLAIDVNLRYSSYGDVKTDVYYDELDLDNVEINTGLRFSF